MRTYLLPLYALLLLALAGPAFAVDGVLEINQTCAVETGCFSGDAPKYPVTIDGTAGRSYRLTSDLIVPKAADTSGIVVSSSSVTIDLNGFEIVRSSCEGATTNCTPTSGTGSGVETTGSNLGISVKNGSITGMGSYGVSLGEQAEVSGLRVRWSRLDGINAGIGSTVSGNTVYENGDHGILVGPGSTVSGNTAYQNGGNGIGGATGTTVWGNTARSNGGNGIGVSEGSTVSDNTAHSNGIDGIRVSEGSTVSGNTAYQNGDDGISVSSGSTVSGNTVRDNGGYGLRLSLTAAYRENTITNNTTGTASGGVNAGGNFCDGTTTCP